MTALSNIRGDLSRAWDNLTQGWHELRNRAAEALTHFRWHPQHSELETADERFLRATSRWAFLAAELSEDEQQVELRLEIPGMESDDFDIHVVDDCLVIRGEKHLERERSSGDYHLMERAYGAFERVFPLPAPVEENSARASYRKGVLRVTVTKAPQAQTRRIPISNL